MLNHKNHWRHHCFVITCGFKFYKEKGKNGSISALIPSLAGNEQTKSRKSERPFFLDILQWFMQKTNVTRFNHITSSCYTE